MHRLSELTRGGPNENFFRWAGQQVIYALCEPTGAPRYVGKSDRPHQRFSSHLSTARRMPHVSPVAGWIRRLLDAGSPPVLRFLEVVLAHEGLPAERRWIEDFWRGGRPLLNSPGTLRRLALRFPELKAVER